MKPSSRIFTENCGKSVKSFHQMLSGGFSFEKTHPLCVMLLRAWNVISLSLVEQLSSARQEFPFCHPQKKDTHTLSRSSSSRRDTSGAIVRKAQLAVLAVSLVGWLKCRRQSSRVKCPKCQAQWRQWRAAKRVRQLPVRSVNLMTAIQGRTFKWCVVRGSHWGGASRFYVLCTLKSSFGLLSFIISSVLAPKKDNVSIAANVEMRMENA